MTEIVYILINQAMPEYVKIGHTTTSVEQRVRELSRSSSVPIPFECYYAARVENAVYVEKRLHEGLDDYRPNKSREFFTIAPEKIVSLLKIAELEDVTPKLDIVDNPDDQKALNDAREKRSRFNFKIVQIPPGETLTFVKDENLIATVVDNRNVEFDGEIMSLTASALRALSSMGYEWKQVQGPAYWSYKGETLVERRIRIEDE